MKKNKTALSKQKQASGTLEPTTWRCIAAPPKMRLHKATGQAYAVLSGKYIFFGLFGTPEATQKYHQTIAEWMAAGKQPVLPPTEVSISEIIAQFWTHAQQYYVHADGSATNEIKNFRQALRPLVALY